MKKDLKRSIKQDELVAGYEHANAWAHVYADELRTAAAVVATVLVLGGGLMWFQGQRKARAEEAFAKALDVYHSDVAGQAAQDAPHTAQTFPTAAEKYQKAASAFDDVAQHHGATPAGKRARYYAALARLQLGQGPAAEKELEAVVGSEGSDSFEGALARLALAGAHRSSGQTDKAVDEYRKLADDAALPLPRDYALMQLASTLEDAHKTGDAVAAYRRLAEEFPESVYAPQARRRVDLLKNS